MLRLRFYLTRELCLKITLVLPSNFRSLLLYLHMNFWESHTLLFCIGMYFFPRLTLFFATPWGGIFWWLGFIFLPRLMVALLATTYYGSTNPLLCLFVWFWALRGDFVEQRRIRAFQRGGVASFQVYNSKSGRVDWGAIGSGRGVVNQPRRDVVEVDAEIIE